MAIKHFKAHINGCTAFRSSVRDIVSCFVGRDGVFTLSGKPVGPKSVPAVEITAAEIAKLHALKEERLQAHGYHGHPAASDSWVKGEV